NRVGRVALLVVMALLTCGLPSSTALAQDQAAAAATRLNRQALEAFDNLNFDQAKTLLEQALEASEKGGSQNNAVTARTHLNLGMLLIAGFQQHDPAVEHFRAALKLDPRITAPAGLFNPEVQTVFDETKASMPAPVAAPSHRVPAPPPPSAARKSDQPEKEVAEEEEEAEEESGRQGAPKFWLSLGLGSGLGLAKGHLEVNRDLDSNGDGLPDNNWSGGLAPARLGHVSVAAGYFLSSQLLLSLEGRLQVISGTTIVKGDPDSGVCVPSCTAPSTALAVFAKGHWFLGTAPLRPFVTGGLGVGSIRQVVTLNINKTPDQAAASTGCGEKGTDTCVDTVRGGLFWMAAGGGLAYELGSLALLGSLTANMGVPHVMFNVDALLGLGLRL
ncbi:MAG: tetratricopeptide repeat protein, partial [Myxococcales bacterium]